MLSRFITRYDNVLTKLATLSASDGCRYTLVVDDGGVLVSDINVLLSPEYIVEAKSRAHVEEVSSASIARFSSSFHLRRRSRLPGWLFRRLLGLRCSCVGFMRLLNGTCEH